MNDLYENKELELLTKFISYIDLISRRQEQQTEIQYSILQEIKLIRESINDRMDDNNE